MVDAGSKRWYRFSAPWVLAGSDRNAWSECLKSLGHLGGNERGDLDPLDRARGIGGVRLSWKGLLGFSGDTMIQALPFFAKVTGRSLNRLPDV